MTTRRQERIAEVLQEELSLLVAAELEDPDLADAMVNVTRVEVSADLRNARVFVEHDQPARFSRRVLERLHHAEGYLRRQLAESLNLRYVPQLTFTVDDTAVRGRRVDEILDHLPPPAVEADDQPAPPGEGEHGPDSAR
jgi:ribosome-binding factor A